jgi:hypothetical protein
METIANKYVYKGEDISFIVIIIIERVVSLIAEKKDRPFDEVYAEFMESQVYRALQDTRSLMWCENAEFIADEYYRETTAAP